MDVSPICKEDLFEIYNLYPKLSIDMKYFNFIAFESNGLNPLLKVLISNYLFLILQMRMKT